MVRSSLTSKVPQPSHLPPRCGRTRCGNGSSPMCGNLGGEEAGGAAGAASPSRGYTSAPAVEVSAEELRRPRRRLCPERRERVSDATRQLPCGGGGGRAIRAPPRQRANCPHTLSNSLWRGVRHQRRRRVARRRAPVATARRSTKLLKSTALCRHGGLSPIQVRSTTRASAAACVRHGAAAAQRARQHVAPRAPPDAARGRLLRDGPAILAALVLDGHLSESAAATTSPEPRARRRKNEQLRADARRRRAAQPAGALRGAARESNRWTRAALRRVRTYRDAKHVLCGEVREHPPVRPRRLQPRRRAVPPAGGRSRLDAEHHRQFPAAFKAACRCCPPAVRTRRSTGCRARRST